MSLKANQIITIKKQDHKPAKYILNCEELSKLLDPISDKEVALISIAGPSRMGKSFLLSYMSRYLANPLEVNWIGEKDDPLIGFGWKTDVDPQTSGIWFSKPFIVRQSNGKEIAVILMDTQGVFDEFATQRDWSTIVGISLLTSSCLIFNLFNNLQEDILMELESFLQYGLLAAKTSNGSDDEIPFQNLMFLIRDWNTPAVFKYGISGGEKFLERKLQLKADQSPTSQTVRRLIKKCFKEVSCFLMPDPGDKAKEDIDFNGSVAHLSDRFVTKMKEFINHFLNPEELKPKMINNKYITGSDLYEYLKAYVEIFNSDELPKPVDIVEATAKTADLIYINKLKDLFLKDMKSYLQTQSFIARKELETHYNLTRNGTIEKFDSSKKSTNREIEKELYTLLNDNLTQVYEQIYAQNEQRREHVANEKVDTCSDLYRKNVSQELDSKFVEPMILDELLKREKSKVSNIFIGIYGNEDKNLFASYYLKLTQFIESCENEFKSENNRRIAEAEKNNSNAVIDSSEAYRQSMRRLLDKNMFLNKEDFKRYEEENKSNAKQQFSESCIYGDSKFIKRFELDFEQKLKESKSEFKSLNRINNEKTILSTNSLLTQTIENYCEKLRESLETISSETEFIERHKEIKSEMFEQFMNSCLYKNEGFLKPYCERFEDEINRAFIEFKSKFSNLVEKVKNSYKNSVIESKEFYIKKMNDLFSENQFYSEEDLNNLHEDIKMSAISHFQSNQNQGIAIDVESYSTELEVLISEEFDKIKQNNKLKRDFKEQNMEVMVNEYQNKYEEEMEKVIESVDSEPELIEKHEEIKDKIIEEFKTFNPFPDSESFDPYLEKLENLIKDSLNDLIDLLNLQLKSQDSTVRNLITDSRKFYKEEMDKYYQKTSFLSREKLQQYNDSVVDRTINKFETERGNMSFDKFKKLIVESLEDIYEKIKEDNDMNTPTLPAIGIDLGTTNSCVAYFKPDKTNGNTIVIPNELGKNTTASVVAFNDSGEVVGDVAKEEAFGNPRNTIFLAKRLIGRQFNDTSVQEDMKHWSYKVIDDGSNNPKFSVKINGIDKTYFPEQISAKVLKKMKEIAENHLGCEVKNAVITVPAYFNDSQKEATKDAGAIAGLNVLKIINEPTAAAIAFKMNRKEDNDVRKVLIYDFGGGTFDVAVLEINRGNIEIKAVGGDNHLGGDDFDTNILKYCLEQFYLKTGINVPYDTNEGQKALRRLRTRCEEQKCKLSSADSTTISVDAFFDAEDISIILTRDKFEELNEDLFIRSMDIVQQTLEDKNMETSDIDDIVLVGGSTRIPRIQEMLTDMFNKPLNHSVNPDEAVAVGAAIQAAILNGNQAQGLGHLKVSDVAPMSLGVKVVGGFMSIIIHRNSKVPNKYTKQYETSGDYQTTVDVEIYEGEEEMAQNNRLLGKFVLSGIPSAPKGEQQINVTFEINDEGILHVNAKIVSTGGEEEIEIKEHKGRLTDKELEDLIRQGN